MQCWFPRLNNSGVYTATKNVNVSITCHFPLSINQSLTIMSRAVLKLTFCLLGHCIPLFLNGSPQVVEALEVRTSSSSHRSSLGFRSGKCRLLHSRYPTFQQPFPIDVTLMSWSIISMKMKLGLCCSCRDTLTGSMMLWTCRCANHKV